MGQQQSVSTEFKQPTGGAEATEGGLRVSIDDLFDFGTIDDQVHKYQRPAFVKLIPTRQSNSGVQLPPQKGGHTICAPAGAVTRLPQYRLGRRSLQVTALAQPCLCLIPQL
jgi:hypothetical protein